MSRFVEIAARKLIPLGIGFYRSLSPLLIKGQCRFVPTCSSYAAQSLHKYRFIKAVFKIAGRLMRCHPFSQGGWDPA